jgi:hypothetical protein
MPTIRIQGNFTAHRVDGQDNDLAIVTPDYAAMRDLLSGLRQVAKEMEQFMDENPEDAA